VVSIWTSGATENNDLGVPHKGTMEKHIAEEEAVKNIVSGK